LNKIAAQDGKDAKASLSLNLMSGLRARRVAFHQQHSLDLIAVYVLQSATNAQDHFCWGHGFNVTHQNAAVAQLHCVM